MKKPQPLLLCPSAPCDSGVMLVGIALQNGRIAYAAERLELSDEFVAAAQKTGAAETMFRFASPCRKQGCGQWKEERCSVIDVVLAVNEHLATSGELPNCSLRPQCRWYAQTGTSACAVCPYIITDS